MSISLINTRNNPEALAKKTKSVKITERQSQESIDTVVPFKRLPRVHPEVTKWFQTMDKNSTGRISAFELQIAFEEFQNNKFSNDLCWYIVHLFGEKGGLGLKTFEKLYFCVKEWVNAFNAYDMEKRGLISEKELVYALQLLELTFSQKFTKFLIKRYLKRKIITLENFLIICLQIHKFTEEFKERDDDWDGFVTIDFEDFLKIVMEYY